MSEKCYGCYWYSIAQGLCAIGIRRDFDCDKNFQPITEDFKEILVNDCDIPLKFLVKKGDLYEWVREEDKPQ